MCCDGAWGDGHWGLMGQRGGSWYLWGDQEQRGAHQLHHFPLTAEALALLGLCRGFPLDGIGLRVAMWVLSILVMWGQCGPTSTKDTPQGSPPHGKTCVNYCTVFIQDPPLTQCCWGFGIQFLSVFKLSFLGLLCCSLVGMRCG